MPAGRPSAATAVPPARGRGARGGKHRFPPRVLKGGTWGETRFPPRPDVRPEPDLACAASDLMGGTMPDTELAEELLQLEEADAYSAHALELAPTDPRVALARARVLLERGQYHAAAAEASRMELRMHEARLADARDTMYALVALRRGQRDQALQIVSHLEERGARGAELTALRAELGAAQGRSPEYASF